MKLLTYKKLGETTDRVGILHRDEQSVEAVANLGLTYQSMMELVKNVTPEEMNTLRMKAEEASAFSVPMAEVVLQAPIPVPDQDILCLGVNYTEHAKESARFKKEAFDLKAEHAVYFSKRVNRATACGEEIPSYEGIVDSLDYEVELAIVLSKDAFQVPLGKGQEYVFGYTIVNDVSARNIQTRHKQWYLGKSLDGFTPMGPYLVTEDEIPYPPKLDIQSYVNGEIRQDSNTEMLIHGIDEVIHDLSACMTLKAGTIISLGTPGGVGMGFQPPKFLKPGDEVVCKIESVGTLSNKIR